MGSDEARQSRMTPQAPPTLGALVACRLTQSGLRHMVSLSLFVASIPQSTRITLYATMDGRPPGSAILRQGFKVIWIDVAVLQSFF